MPTLTPPPPAGPVRLAYIMSRFPRLTETFVLNEITALMRRGVRIDVFPLVREHADVIQDDVAAVQPFVHYHPFVSAPILWANLRALVRSPIRYLATGCSVLRQTWPSRNFRIGAAGIWLKTVKIAEDCRRFGVTHVHAHFANHPALAAYIIRRLTGITYSFTAHGSDLHKDQTMLGAKIAASELTIMISAYNRRFALERAGAAAADRMEIISCGIDVDAFRPSTGPRRPGPFRILCVAALREVKGHTYLLQGCRALRDEGRAFECRLIGDGPLRERLEEEVRELGLESAVRFLGPKPRAEVLAGMQDADVVALTSIQDRKGRREGIPVTLMEAMACEVPVVASRQSGIPELVEHDVSGLLTEPASPDDIAAALRRLMDEPDLCRRLGRAAREKVRRDFNLNETSERVARRLVGLAADGARRGSRSARAKSTSVVQAPASAKGVRSL